MASRRSPAACRAVLDRWGGPVLVAAAVVGLLSVSAQLPPAPRREPRVSLLPSAVPTPPRSPRGVTVALPVPRPPVLVRVLTLDIIDPLHPVEVSLGPATRLPYTPATEATAGAFVYAFSEFGVLRILDVRRPEAPGYRGHDLSVAAVGRYAYVAMGAAGLRIVDTGAPGSPPPATWYDIPGAARAVLVEGDSAFVVVEQLRVATSGYD